MKDSTLNSSKVDSTLGEPRLDSRSCSTLSSPQLVLIDQEDCTVSVMREWLSPSKAERLYKRLVKELEWDHQTLKMYGKEFPEPRLTYPMGNDGLVHKYTGTAREVRPWIKPIKRLRDRVEDEVGFASNSCLINYYRDQKDGISYHSDKETTPPEHFVVTISLGATRDILLKRKDKTGKTIKVPLHSGDLCFMSGRTQELWMHSIPKRTGLLNGRIALTFRELVHQG
jgi:alkylated DNA repair dioxygenase AlkB